MESLYLIVSAVVALFVFILCVLIFRFFNFWLRARLANAPVGLFKMFGMSLRKVPVGMIVDNRITAVKAGIDIPSDPLEAHYLAGGDVNQVILALIAADKAGISLDFNRACAIDLATKGTGKTVLEAVRTSINPKVIDAPNPAMSILMVFFESPSDRFRSCSREPCIGSYQTLVCGADPSADI